MKTANPFFLQKLLPAFAVIAVLHLSSCKGAEAKEAGKAEVSKKGKTQAALRNGGRDATEKPSCCKGIPSRQKMCVKKMGTANQKGLIKGPKIHP